MEHGKVYYIDKLPRRYRCGNNKILQFSVKWIEKKVCFVLIVQSYEGTIEYIILKDMDSTALRMIYRVTQDRLF